MARPGPPLRYGPLVRVISAIIPGMGAGALVRVVGFGTPAAWP
jgi:hypothetical protein